MTFCQRLLSVVKTHYSPIKSIPVCHLLVPSRYVTEELWAPSAHGADLWTVKDRDPKLNDLDTAVVSELMNIYSEIYIEMMTQGYVDMLML